MSTLNFLNTYVISIRTVALLVLFVVLLALLLLAPLAGLVGLFCCRIASVDTIGGLIGLFDSKRSISIMAPGVNCGTIYIKQLSFTLYPTDITSFTMDNTTFLTSQR